MRSTPLDSLAVVCGSEASMPEFILLGDVIKLPVHTERTHDGYRAWCPQWPGKEAGGATAGGAISKLQYVLEAELVRGSCPTLEVSP
jgi:hypothetical protein